MPAISEIVEEISKTLGIEISQCPSAVKELQEDLKNAKIKLKLQNETSEQILSELSIFGIDFESTLHAVKHLKNEYLALKCSGMLLCPALYDGFDQF